MNSYRVKLWLRDGDLIIALTRAISAAAAELDVITAVRERRYFPLSFITSREVVAL